MQLPRDSSVCLPRRPTGALPKRKKQQALNNWNTIAERFYLLAVPSIAISFVICRFSFNTFTSYLLAGSVLSLLAEGMVIASYFAVKSWRRHPSRILLYRSYTNVLFAVITIVNVLRAISDNADDTSSQSFWCMTLSFFTQLSFFAGECWLLIISCDLVISLSNPFTSIHGNLKKYKALVWSASGLSAFALIMSSECQGITTDVCWLKVEGFGSSCLWTFILGWILLYYVFTALVLVYTFLRISRGLESTYETRKSCAVKHLHVLLAYFGYAVLLLVLYGAYLANEEEEEDGNHTADRTTSKTLGYILTISIGCRGVVDALLWFRMHRKPGRITLRFSTSLFPWLAATFNCCRSVKGDRNVPLLNEVENTGTRAIVERKSEVQVHAACPYMGAQDVPKTRISGCSSSGADGIAFRLWNASGTEIQEREVNANSRISSSANFPAQWNRLSSFMNSDDRYMSSFDVPSVDQEAAVGEEDIIDGDDDMWVDYSLNPQLNLALRQEVLQIVTQGILKSIQKANSITAAISSGHTDVGIDGDLSRTAYLKDHGEESVPSSNRTVPDVSARFRSSFLGNMLSNLLVTDEKIEATYEHSFHLDEKQIFTDRYPLVFRKLRSLLGISDEWYSHQIALPAQERLSEGSSGAFMFFCGSGEFMVKTISSFESKVLSSILMKYATHLSNNPESMLVRFLGLHELKMYNQTFNFVVMKNIFPPSATINLKYDIKGSWVNRSSSGLMPPGTKTFCKHCGEPFRVGSSGKCPARVGSHEPNLVLKDNDLSTKIRMRPEEAYQVIDALHKDSDALCQMGITDYSLLVGVRNLSYDIDPEAVLNKRSKSFVNFYTRDGTEALSLSNGNGNSSECMIDPPSYIDSIERKREPSSNVGAQGMPSYYSKAADTAHSGADPDTAVHDGYLARAVIAPGIYYFGIVDILQTWSFSKKMEKLMKVRILGEPADGISCMPPEPYKERFQRKVSEVIEHSIFVRQVTGSWKGKREMTGPTSLIPEV